MQVDISEQASAILANQGAARRVAVLVLGMHRSGTSLLSRLLSLYGCDLPRHLLPANDANSEGYWESAAVVALNDALLASGGSIWHDWLGFNSRWYDSPKKDEFLNTARDVLKTEFGGSSLFVLKDPRICRLVPFWLEALEKENIHTVILLPVRHPAMVARSLETRDGILSPVGHLLWLRHILQAEIASRGRPRAILTFNQILEDWQALPERIGAAVGVQWPRGGMISQAQQADFINPDMAHSEAALQNRPENQNLSKAIAQAWAIFARWAKTGESSGDHAMLDALREELDLAGALTGEALRLSMNAQWLSREKDLRIEALNGDLSRSAIERDTQHVRLNDLENTLADMRDKSSQMDEFTRILTGQQEEARALAAEREQALADAQLQVTEAEGKLAFTESNLRQRYAELDQLRHELDQLHTAEKHYIETNALLRTEIVGTREELEVVRASLNDAVARNSHLEQKVVMLRGLIDRAEADRDYANQRNRTLENVTSTLQMQDLRVSRLTEELQSARAQVDQAQRKAMDHKQEAQRSTSLVAQLKDEIGSLRHDAAELQHQIERSEQDHHSISQQLIDEQQLAQASLEQQQWLQAINQALTETERWWVQFLPPSYRQRMLRQRLVRRNLFNGDAYLSRYNDVAQSGMEPLQHYIRHGMFEGRIRT